MQEQLDEKQHLKLQLLQTKIENHVSQIQVLRMKISEMTNKITLEYEAKDLKVTGLDLNSGVLSLESLSEEKSDVEE